MKIVFVATALLALAACSEAASGDTSEILAETSLQTEVEQQPMLEDIGRDNPTPELFGNAIGYYVNEDAGFVCEGERWVAWPNERVAWYPEDGSYYLLFAYRYDGQTLTLFDGHKFEIGGEEPVESVSNRSLRLTSAGAGSWLLNGQSLTECR